MSVETAAKGGLAERIAAIEEAYEFMLAYAAQGHQRGHEGEHIRDYLKRLDAALDGIAAAATATVANDAGVFGPFVATLEEDARKARAGLQAGAGAAGDRLAARRQSQRVDPSAYAAHRSFPARRSDRLARRLNVAGGRNRGLGELRIAAGSSVSSRFELIPV